METVVDTTLMEINEESSSTNSNEDEEDDFFSNITRFLESRIHRSLKPKAQNLVKTWLEAVSKEVLIEVAFWGEKVLIDMFFKYDTAISPRAIVERPFSMSKDILRAK
ncbi:Hypothetical predicted protein [Octopus vulgaris]|uniref:Uncharacterized protein n=1 Tax=Octopus vulgaris TaxID=6645 RepID=A0AA36B4S4_OCTVU|nr:Hypothetical predicted protein [Octopus vulgaris]